MPFITAAGHRLEYEILNPQHAAAPWLVFLHEGLGSVAMWKDFPLKLCVATGCRGLVYSRHGYGKSDPLTAPRRADFMHDEARHALPQLLDQLHIANPVLFGHSDGASIALLHAGLTSRPVAALVAMAPHVMVEDISIASIEAASVTWQTTDLRERLRPYHADPDSAFRGWNDIWLHPDFRSWNIEDCLPGIRCPVLAIQGVDDEYGTLDQIDRIARGAVNAEVELLKLADCRHSPHKDQPEAVIAAVQRFLARMP
ncbi:MAG: alpha/beta hydrolase [Betaproteobacteria bacterium]|nr:alpha/beta hydrolase [Betaproteobacteria bacterium]